MSNLRSICILFLLALVTASLSFSQAVKGSLVGTVTDSSGASMPNTKVTITETNTGSSRSVTTNDSGNYSFPNLTPGTYTVVAEQTGFKRASRANVDVIVDTSSRIDLQLTPGEMTEVVNVTAEVPILQTERSDTGRKIEAKQVTDLPMAGNHNFQSLSILVPGAARPESQHSAFFNPQTSYATRFNGQSRLANNLELEGVDNNERTGLLQVLIPPQEAIQTVDIATSDYDAELGRATGGAINVVLKSGTNAFHGSAYEFNRVSALAARNYFDVTKGHFTYNYFGGSIGGPIIHNRTFFFGDYLRIEDHSANNDRLTVPTADMRTGNLGVSTTTIYNPFTGNADGSGRTPFGNNVIPASLINPVSQKILSVIPLPNLAGVTNNYFVTSPFYRNTDQFDVKIDHNQTDSDRISARLSYARPVTFDGSVYGIYGGPRGTGGAGFEGTGVQGTYSGALSYDHIFSPTLLMETRFGVNRYRNDAKQVGYGEKVADQLGVPGVNQNDFSSGPVGVNLDNFGNPFIGFSPSLPWIRAETNILFTNIWTKTKGNHTIKFGFDMRRIRDDLLQTQTFSPRGLYHFGVAQTSTTGSATSFGNSFASFLLDVPNDVGRDLPILFPAYRAWQFFGFVQDKWQITPKLTVDIGLRWEYYPPASPASAAGFSQYHPENNTLVLAGVGNNPLDMGLDKHHKDFAPRLGIAYRLNEKTVIRTGFGISYAPWPDNKYAFDNFPVKQNNSYTSTCSLCPAILPSGQTATFQLGFPAATPAIIPSNGIIDASPAALLNQAYETVNPHFREPYVESWNFAIQRALPNKFSIDVAYVGNHGVAQPAQYNLNASTVLNGGVASQPLNQLYGKRANVTLLFNGYSSSYNGLQVKLDKRFSGGFAMTTAYTFSKSLGYQSEDSGIDFYVNGKRNWRRLNFDRTHFFVQSYIYELPFGKNKKYLSSGPGMWILGGWQLNGILTLATGAPIDITSPNAALNTPGNNNTPNWVGPGPIPILHNIGAGQAWFQNAKCSATVTSQCFAQPAAGTFGNLSKNPIPGPGYSNFDFSLFRNFKVTERWTLQFRGEAFSLLNHPQFGNPNGDISSANFGIVTGTANSLPGGIGTGARQIQLGAKLIF